MQRLRPVRAPSRTSSKKGKPSKRRSSNNSPALLIGGGVALLLLIAGAGAWMLMGGGEVAPNPNGPGPAPVAGNNPPVTGTTPSVTPQTATSGETTAAVPLQVQTVAGVELEPRSVLGGRVRLLIPKSFGEMDDEVRNAKYPAAQRPTLVYTNDDGTINIAFSHTQTRMMANEFPAAIPQLEGTFRKLVQGEDWIGTTTPMLSGTKWLSLDFRIKAVDMVIRNWMTMTSLENRLLIISVNAPQANEGTWNEVAKAIQQSIQLSGPTESPNPVPGIAQSNRGFNGPPDFGFGNSTRSKNSTPVKPLPAAALGQNSVTITVSGLKSFEQGEKLQERLVETIPGRSTQSSLSGDSLTFTSNGAGDLKALADALEIGDVIKIDEATRTISIRAKPLVSQP